MKHFLKFGEDDKLTEDATAIVDGFVMRWFGEEITKWLRESKKAKDGEEVNLKELDMVQWGKAQGKFMTVPGLEHLHVFVRRVLEEILQKWAWPSGRC